MLTTSEKLIANTSYTNKDFQSIYPELLDLVKKITYRWDPSISNESDPGVILLKLNAIIADKCNYNIDKNVLECFPLSVTQDKNARQLYEQLGYYMHWYNGATFGLEDFGTQDSPITVRWIGETGDNSLKLEDFTMITDDENSVVYTLLPTDTMLPMDGSYTRFSAVQGIATTYEVNGSSLITAENLDSYNRIYFEHYNVSQNGIFICNAGARNFTSWKRVDNLLVQDVSPSSRFYKFGVTQDTNVCYIEFPINAQEIIGEGINITYLRTMGEAGNVGPFVLNHWYGEVVVNDNGTDIILDDTNTQINNYYASVDGQDPEGIDEAYEGYKRVVGTFDTLVTLRDYINAAINSPNVSNAIVSDRTNDIQVSYDIVTFENGIDQLTNVIEDELMSPFDIKFYALYAASRSDNVYTASGFNDTFQFIDYIDTLSDSFDYVGNLKAYMNDEKHISNDFAFLLDTNPANEVSEKGKYKFANRVCLIKNKYPVTGIIIPQYKLPDKQIDEIKNNVQVAILQALKSSKLNFGEEIDYDYVYDAALKADERIKTVVLNDIIYQTYAVYLKVDNNTQLDATPEFIEVRIDEVDETYPEISKQIRKDIVAKSVLAGTTQFFTPDENMSPQVGQNWIDFGDNRGFVVEGSSVTTDLDKDFTVDSVNNVYTYVVGQNETVSLLAHNLIDTTEYTSYVRYAYKLLNDVYPDQSYELSGDEFISFYWTTDVDSGYAFATYGAGQIFKPSFKLTATGSQSGNPSNLPNALANLLAAADPKYITGYTYNFADEETDVEAHIAECEQAGNILSANKTISIQKINEIELNHDDYWCSWILNSTDEGVATLFNEDEQEYRLKTGEYFIYTNSTRTSLVVLGAGTLLTRDASWTDAWSCEEFNFDELISEGVDVLITSPRAMQRVPVDQTLTAVEMKFISLNEGATLRLTASSSVNPAPKIKTRDGNNAYSYNFYGTPFINIEYKGKNETSFTSVPMVTVGNSSWVLMSQLNLNMSMNAPQLLTVGQKMTLNLTDDSSVSIEPDANSPEIYVVSSEPIVAEGGVNVNVVIPQITDDDIIPKFSQHTVVESTTDVAYTESGIVGIRLTSATPAQQLEMTLPPGKYIIAFRHGNNNVSSLELKYPDGNGTALNRLGSSETDLSLPKTYYLELNVVEGASQGLYLLANFRTADVEDNFTIMECFKYTFNNKLLTEDEDPDGSAVFDRITELNKDLMFDFTYIVDEDDDIEKPLDPMAFFNPNHIYNGYTIGQLDTKSLANIFVNNKIRS